METAEEKAAQARHDAEHAAADKAAKAKPAPKEAKEPE